MSGVMRQSEHQREKTVGGKQFVEAKYFQTFRKTV